MKRIKHLLAALILVAIGYGWSSIVSGDRLDIGVTASDPAGYWTAANIIGTGEDNLLTLRNPDGNVAARYQDKNKWERAASGYGKDVSGYPYRYTFYTGIGNITGDDQGSRAKDTSYIVSNEHVGRTGLPNSVIPQFLINGRGCNGLRGANATTGTGNNAYYNDPDGDVAIGNWTPQPGWQQQDCADVPRDILLVGTVRMSGLPTSASGLSSGDVWNDAGTLKIVP